MNKYHYICPICPTDNDATLVVLLPQGLSPEIVAIECPRCGGATLVGTYIQEEPKKFRCTRPAVYGPGCPGHTDPSARQGYYFEATGPDAARFMMGMKFPTETTFDCEEWED